ncbi:hypothetical protein [Streptomyces odonnellii]|uniref:hypothetical protein n=1 Tax=Streptomyces odonnellii TaxID=1417980 RepID=UPI000625CA99|nr:hypothetical protein [Streptomyces odonnellii]
MQMPPINAFSETAALYAVLSDDDQEAQRLVSSMLPCERAVFAGQLDKLRRMMTDRFGNDLGQTALTQSDARPNVVQH